MLSGTFARENFLIISIVAASVILGFLILLAELRLKRKIKEENEKKAAMEKAMNYINQVKKIKSEKKDAKARLNNLNIVSKNLFHDFFGISRSLSYSEIIEKLGKMKKYDYIEFCRDMQDEYYSEKEISREKIAVMAEKLIGIIIKEQKIFPVKPEKSPGTQKNLKNELSIFIRKKLESQKIANSFYSSKKIMELSKKTLNSEKETTEMFAKNKDVYNELKKLSVSLKFTHNSLNSLIQTKYNESSSHAKKSIDSLLSRWRNEKKKIFSQAKNPIRQHIIDIYLLDKYFREFMRIINENQENKIRD